MKVTIAVSLIWFMFTVIFVDLGIAHWSEADNTIPPFPVPEFRVGKFTVEFHSAGETAGAP